MNDEKLHKMERRLSATHLSIITKAIANHSTLGKPLVSNVHPLTLEYAVQLSKKEAPFYLPDHPHTQQIVEAGYCVFIASYFIVVHKPTQWARGYMCDEILERFNITPDSEPDFWNIRFCVGGIMGAAQIEYGKILSLQKGT